MKVNWKKELESIPSTLIDIGLAYAALVILIDTPKLAPENQGLLVSLFLIAIILMFIGRFIRLVFKHLTNKSP